MSYLDYVCNSCQFLLIDDPKPTHFEPDVNLVVGILIVRMHLLCKVYLFELYQLNISKSYSHWQHVYLAYMKPQNVYGLSFKTSVYVLTAC